MATENINQDRAMEKVWALVSTDDFSSTLENIDEMSPLLKKAQIKALFETALIEELDRIADATGNTTALHAVRQAVNL